MSLSAIYHAGIIWDDTVIKPALRNEMSTRGMHACHPRARDRGHRTFWNLRARCRDGRMGNERVVPSRGTNVLIEREIGGSDFTARRRWFVYDTIDGGGGGK